VPNPISSGGGDSDGDEAGSFEDRDPSSRRQAVPIKNKPTNRTV